MEYSSRPREKRSPVKPRIIIHGGAGNISRSNLPPLSYQAYRDALLSILEEANDFLRSPSATCLDVATLAVTRLENNLLFNASHGAVFTRAGTHELEASVMVSRGYRKKGVGVMQVSHVKHPILLAKEMLIRGEETDGGGAYGHVQLAGAEVESLAKQWGLQTVAPGYYWTKRRWQEHRRGLGLSYSDHEYQKARHDADKNSVFEASGEGNWSQTAGSVTNDPSWDGHEYLPQGTVGCVVLDSTGTLCVATSTGGLTNKLPGRIGDTPTLGAGFWAEEWPVSQRSSTTSATSALSTMSPSAHLAAAFSGIADCLPGLSSYSILAPPSENGVEAEVEKPDNGNGIRAVAMSGTGNGDSFLRLSAVRTAAAMARFKRTHPEVSEGMAPLQDAISAVAGPNGFLQQSAEDRWLVTGEGEGGMIGIDLRNGRGYVVADFNCGGMFRCWIDDDGRSRMMVLRKEY